MARTSIYTPRSSKPLIKNAPSQLVYVSHVIENAPQMISDAVNAAIEEETEYLRETLPMEHPDYQEIIDYFGIEYDAETSSFVYVVDEEYAEQARTIEYGTPRQAPAAVLRNAARNGSARLSSTINHNLSRMLGR